MQAWKSGNRGLSKIPPSFVNILPRYSQPQGRDRSSRAKDDWHHVEIWARVATIALTISVWGVQILPSQIGYLPFRLSYLPHLNIYRIGISDQGTYLKVSLHFKVPAPTGPWRVVRCLAESHQMKVSTKVYQRNPIGYG